MPHHHPSLILHILRNPKLAADLDAVEWGLLLRQARSNNLIGQLLAWIDLHYPNADWPSKAKDCLNAERNVSRQRSESLIWEARQLALALSANNVRPILLKGAAYVADGMAVSDGRHFGDIDILVKKEQLANIESTLLSLGWMQSKQSKYDQYYYRQWMHEIPPLIHIRRGTNLDVHHAILPLTARYKPDTQKLFERTHPAKLFADVDVLSAEDMFLHAAVHLFCEGEYQNALRNLWDLRCILLEKTDCGQVTAKSLTVRAEELSLQTPLALACHFIKRAFAEPVTAEVLSIQKQSGAEIQIDWFHRFVYTRIFAGTHPTNLIGATGLARTALYLKGHYLRMPLGLLSRHLLTKAFQRKEV